jgi:hypothetical protein
MQRKMGQVRQAETMMIGKITTNSQNTNPGLPKIVELRRKEP